VQQLAIITNRLIIRNLLVTDLDDFHIYRSNPEVTKYQGFDVMTREDCGDFIRLQEDKTFGKAGQWIQYAIALKDTGDLVGDCAVKLDQNDIRLAEIGITISHLHQQQGYGKEVMTGLINWLFKTQNIVRITETVDAENTASINLLKSLNFREEGHFIENIFFKGKWGSEYQFAMLKKEWKI
jgi:ribosomal-protein-alanine N-acetyltransferase